MCHLPAQIVGSLMIVISTDILPTIIDYPTVPIMRFPSLIIFRHFSHHSVIISTPTTFWKFLEAKALFLEKI